MTKEDDEARQVREDYLRQERERAASALEKLRREQAERDGK